MLKISSKEEPESALHFHQNKTRFSNLSPFFSSFLFFFSKETLSLQAKRDMKYTTYLFDFDYTLADSSRGIVICFRNVLERHGHTHITDEAIKRTIGKTLEDSFSILTGITLPDVLADYKKEYVKEADTYMTANTVLFSETIPVLTTLKERGAKIGIISTKFRYRIWEMLDPYFPKNFFDIIIGGEDVKKAKPHPQGINKALRRLHRRKSETLYIGDSTVDAETAQLAKVDFVGVLNGMTTREELAAYPHRQILDNLSLLPLINEFIPYQPNRYIPEKIIAIYRLLHQKQIRGKHEVKEEDACCICKNCGRSFHGNHCPHCGQHRNTPRFTLHNAFQNILSGFFNVDNGFTRNLLELLYRPGYMIRDYLKGKRVHYFKPFQNLFVLAALYIMTVQLIDPAALRSEENEVVTQEEATLSDLIDNIQYQQKKALNDRTKHYLSQSITYADSARLTENDLTSKALQLKIDTNLSNKSRKKLRREINRQIKEELQEKIKKTPSIKDGEVEDWQEMLQEIGDSMAYKDSIRIAILGRETTKQDSMIAEIREEILTELIQEKNADEENAWNGIKKAVNAIASVFNELTDHYFSENSFLTSVCNLMKGWIHGNKAFSILALLPLLTLATRWTFRRTYVGRQLNVTENFFAQVYIACQILWISLIILPFTGKAHVNDLFDLSNQAIFVLFVWDYRQLFGLSWWKSLRYTILMFWYCILILIFICILVTAILLLIAQIVEITY